MKHRDKNGLEEFVDGTIEDDWGETSEPYEALTPAERVDIASRMEDLCRPLLGRIEETLAIARGYRDQHDAASQFVQCSCELCQRLTEMMGRRDG